MKNIVIVHHDDHDGWAAAWAARHFLNKTGSIKTFATQYDRPFPTEFLRGNDEVYVLDFSYPREVLEQINQQVDKLVVIEHHKGKFDEIGDLPYVIFDETHAGCMLAWMYFVCQNNDGRIHEVPDFLLYVEDRDLWRFALSPTKQYIAGLDYYGNYRDFDFWDKVVSKEITTDQIIGTGMILEKAGNAAAAAMAAKCTAVVIDGKNVGFMNLTSQISEVGNKIALMDGLDYSLTWFQGTKGVIFSLRSVDEKVDVCELAKSLGGNGHRNSAGFTTSFEVGFALITKLMTAKQACYAEFI